MAAKGDSSGASATPASKAGKVKSRILLLDSYSLAFRAFFALPETLVTSSGQVTNAVSGFTSMLIKLESEERPDAVIACMDKGEPQFRLDQYPEYKAGRSETPDTLRQQIPLIRAVLEALCVPVVELEGYEADDLLATLARRGREAGHHVIIVSGDRDCLQLVNDDVTVLMNRRGVTDMIRYDPATVVERYGVGPERWTDFAALKGEQADNLPGVPGVGDKTAARLLAQYGSIEGIIEHAEELTPKIRKGIEECADQVKLNRKLGRLLDDVPLETDESLFVRRPWDPETVRKLFTSLEFRTLYQRLLALAPDTEPPEEAVIRPSSISRWTSGADRPRGRGGGGSLGRRHGGVLRPAGRGGGAAVRGSRGPGGGAGGRGRRQGGVRGQAAVRGHDRQGCGVARRALRPQDRRLPAGPRRQRRLRAQGHRAPPPGRRAGRGGGVGAGRGVCGRRSAGGPAECAGRWWGANGGWRGTNGS